MPQQIEEEEPRLDAAYVMNKSDRETWPTLMNAGSGNASTVELQIQQNHRTVCGK